MADTATQEKKKKIVVSVTPFEIEAAHPRNCDLYIQVTGTRLRSRIKPVKEVFDRRDGEQITRPTSAKVIDELPGEIVGQQMQVRPGDLTYKVIDPIDADTLKAVQKAMKAHSGSSVSEHLRGVKDQEGKLNKDEMKTLVRELVRIVQSGEAKVTRGTLPDMADVDDLPGKYLLNSRNLSNWHQPRYEEDLDNWTEKLNHLD